MDGSYMKDLSTSACSGAFILHCTNTSKEIKGCFVDSSHQADNYRGEFLGALGPLLLLRAAFMANPQVEAASAKIRLYCDNKGVVAHGNKVDEVLKSEQVQADLIRLMKTYSRLIPVQLQWIHVHGHSDDTTPSHKLSLAQQLNVRCDALARKYLLRAIQQHIFIHPSFPDEDIILSIRTEKIRSSTRKAIYKNWGTQLARDLFDKRNKVPRDSFDLIYWEIIPKVMKEFPKTFQDWVTRHISDFNGCNRYLSRWKPTVKNVCPSCGIANEDTKHITRCKDTSRTALFMEGIEEIRSWL
eukprot:scaffold78445_cov84-Cyclotella_meneghiniana.AAC.1